MTKKLSELNSLHLVLKIQKTKDVKILRKFATHPHCEVREAVAANRKCPNDLLWDFANDPYYSVRIAAVTNHNMKSEQITKLFNERFDVTDHNSGEYQSTYIVNLLSNPNTSQDIIDECSGHPDIVIKKAALAVRQIKNTNKYMVINKKNVVYIDWLLGGVQTNTFPNSMDYAKQLGNRMGTLQYLMCNNKFCKIAELSDYTQTIVYNLGKFRPDIKPGDCRTYKIAKCKCKLIESKRR